MASGRFLSVSVAEDDKLSRLSVMAEYVYLKAIPHLDRDGMITGKPGLLYCRVCPTREELFGNLQSIIDEWVAVGLVVSFMTDEGLALFFKGFSKNNNLPHYDRERPSRFPAPPGYYRADNGLLPLGTEPPSKKVKKAKPDPIPPSSGDSHGKVQELVQDHIQDEVLELVPIFGTEEEEQEEDQDKEQAKQSACLPDAETETDQSLALVRLAYETVGKFGPRLQEAGGRAVLATSLELIERFGYQACVRGLSTVKERDNALIVKSGGRERVTAPIAYLRTIMEREAVSPPVATVLEFALEDIAL